MTMLRLTLNMLLLRKVGTFTVLLAELWAIYHAWNLGFRRIIVESDNVEAIQILQNKSHAFSDHALVIYIWNLASRSWELNFNHASCSPNSVADRLTCLGRGAPFGAWIFQEPLVEAAAAVIHDMHVEV
ncbi:hypothetical protein V6N12_049038 [Hibiscus sabdariffa]|uniref:RNase H type-1 domain-containing protein n=1 Tax=Hibiscus sabdariffa TaxID=183260 RepID=A0ABR2EJ08_9ROSI